MSVGGYVVTGATSGIGEEVARRLIARGDAVLAVARRRERLEALCDGSPNASFVAADLSAPDSVEEVCRAANEAFGAVRGFVHCAGFDALAPLGLVQDATAHSLFAVHALFPMRFLGWMGRATNHAKCASCVLVSSVACREGVVGNAAYAAAKGAVEGMLKSAAAELVRRGVRLNVVVAGVVETAMARSSWMAHSTPEQIEAAKARYPLGFGTPRQVADAIDFLLGPASSWITGQCLVADGGHSLT